MDSIESSNPPPTNQGSGSSTRHVVTFMDKVKKVLAVSPQTDIPLVVKHYKDVYKAVETESCYPRFVELQFMNSTVVVTTKDPIDAEPKPMFELECDDVQGSFDTALHTGAQELPISNAERIRGVKFKVQDPFGFTCALKEKTSLTESLRIRPYFPALWSESSWWISVQNVSDWKDSLNSEQRDALTLYESHVTSCAKSLVHIKKMRFYYKCQQLNDFCSHSYLSDLLDELEHINAILQGVGLVCFINRHVRKNRIIWNLYKDLQIWYASLANTLPTLITSEYDQSSGRRAAAYVVRQLLKALLHVRRDINDEKSESYGRLILDEENKMCEVIKQEVGHWRKQGRWESRKWD